MANVYYKQKAGSDVCPVTHAELPVPQVSFDGNTGVWEAKFEGGKSGVAKIIPTGLIFDKLSQIQHLI